MIPFDEALHLVLDGVAPLPRERVALDAAAGRVLADDLIAGHPLPPFSYSAMDGYAVRLADLSGDGPHELPVDGESRAGSEPNTLPPGAARRIFTGAILPDGADAVIMQENVTRDGDRMRFDAAPRDRQNVREQGGDLAQGALALPAGTRLTPGAVGLAATLDQAHLKVHRRPIVTILSTGDELRSPGEPGRPGSIPESNSFVIAALARQVGAIARVCPMVADDAASTEAAIRAALAGSDLTVTIGGVSVGDHDLVRPALEAAGMKRLFWKVALKPGKPVTAGRAGSGHVLGLPGNPGSATLTFMLFGLPLLRTLQGDRQPLPQALTLAVRGRARHKPGRREYLRARLEVEDGGLVAVLPGNQSSGAVTSFASAEALVVVPLDHGDVEEGQRLEVLRIADF